MTSPTAGSGSSAFRFFCFFSSLPTSRLVQSVLLARRRQGAGAVPLHQSWTLCRCTATVPPLPTLKNGSFESSRIYAIEHSTVRARVRQSPHNRCSNFARSHSAAGIDTPVLRNYWTHRLRATLLDTDTDARVILGMYLVQAVAFGAKRLAQRRGVALRSTAAYDALTKELREVARLEEVSGILSYDEQCFMSEGSAAARRAEGSARRRDPRKADIDANGRSHRRCARLEARRRARERERARRDRGLRRGEPQEQGPGRARGAPRERVFSCDSASLLDATRRHRPRRSLGRRLGRPRIYPAYAPILQDACLR